MDFKSRSSVQLVEKVHGLSWIFSLLAIKSHWVQLCIFLWWMFATQSDSRGWLGNRGGRYSSWIKTTFNGVMPYDAETKGTKEFAPAGYGADAAGTLAYAKSCSATAGSSNRNGKEEAAAAATALPGAAQPRQGEGLAKPHSRKWSNGACFGGNASKSRARAASLRAAPAGLSLLSASLPRPSKGLLLFCCWQQRLRLHEAERQRQDQQTRPPRQHAAAAASGGGEKEEGVRRSHSGGEFCFASSSSLSVSFPPGLGFRSLRSRKMEPFPSSGEYGRPLPWPSCALVATRLLLLWELLW